MKKNLGSTFICAFFVVITAFLFNGVFKNIENATLDMRSNLSTDKGIFSKFYKPASKEIVILSIDEAAAAEIANPPEIKTKSWPFSRFTWAKIVNYIEHGHPKVVGIDVV